MAHLYQRLWHNCAITLGRASGMLAASYAKPAARRTGKSAGCHPENKR